MCGRASQPLKAGLQGRRVAVLHAARRAAVAGSSLRPRVRLPAGRGAAAAPAPAPAPALLAASAAQRRLLQAAAVGPPQPHPQAGVSRKPPRSTCGREAALSGLVDDGLPLEGRQLPDQLPPGLAARQHAALGAHAADASAWGGGGGAAVTVVLGTCACLRVVCVVVAVRREKAGRRELPGHSQDVQRVTASALRPWPCAGLCTYVRWLVPRPPIRPFRLNPRPLFLGPLNHHHLVVGCLRMHIPYHL